MKHSSRSFLAVLALVACRPVSSARAPQSAAPDATEGTPRVAASPQAAPSVVDADIARAVRDELTGDPSIPDTGIDVVTKQGIVELTGHVPHLLARARADRIAESIRGVRAVSNRLEVDTPKRPDAELAQSVRHALLLDPAAVDVDVDVIARVAILRGVVQSAAEAAVVERVAMSVRGLIDVRSQLTIEYDVDRSDPEIAQDVQERLKWDNLVDQAGIQVSVSDGKVVLAGVVGSAAEKRRAQELAWVNGTRMLSADDLVVRAWLREQSRRDTITPTDGQIEDAFRLAAMFDPRVAAHRIQPHAEGGTLRLEGSVASLGAKRAAEQLGNNTVGVTRVHNRIVVDRGDTNDDKLRRDAVWALDSNPITDPAELRVDVTDAVATLHGRVDSYAEAAEAVDVVARLDGVRRVDSDLVVDDRRTTFYCDPFVQPYCPYVEGWDVYPRVADGDVSDTEIEDRIVAEFAWSPWIRADEIDVSVDSGVATLTGEVQGARARNAAILNALEGGAIGVVDNLDVSWP